jgi:hypothetical protein
MLGAVTIPTPIGAGVKISFAKPSEQRAAAVLPSVVQSALSGNLTALKCLDERRTIGIAKEQAVWAGGYQQVVTQRPELLQLYNQNKARIPAVNESSPETAAASALANPYSGGGAAPAATTAGDKPALSAAFDSTVKAAGALPLWLTIAIAVGAGYFIYKAVKKG